MLGTTDSVTLGAESRNENFFDRGKSALSITHTFSKILDQRLNAERHIIKLKVL